MLIVKKALWVKNIIQFFYFSFIILFSLFLIDFSSSANATNLIPEVKLTTKPIDFSNIPSTEELMAAGQLGGQLYPTEDIAIEEKNITGFLKFLRFFKIGEPKKIARNQAINLSFGKAIEAWNRHEYNKAVELFKQHHLEYPDSPWNSEAVLHLGCEARYSGRYSESEEYFQWILENQKGKNHFGAKMLLNKARSRLAVQKVFQNEFEESLEIFRSLKKESPDWRHRVYASHWIQRLSRYKADRLALMDCGTKALAHILKNDGKLDEANEVSEIVPTSRQGYSLDTLSSMASQYGYKTSGRCMTSADIHKIPVPAIAHITSKDNKAGGHYWVIEKVENSGLTLFDPQNKRRFSQSYEVFSREWNGNILLFSNNMDLPGIKLAKHESNDIYGGCCGLQRPEDNLGNPGSRNNGEKASNDKSSCGSPTWSVNMVNMNLFITDTPIWHNTPVGPSVHISLSYNSQSTIAYNEPFGNKWQYNYGSYLVENTVGTVIVFMPDGRRDVFTPDSSEGYESPYRVYNDLVKTGDNRFELRFPDDTVYIYDIPVGTTSLQPFLVEIRDSYGQSLTFNYNANIQLTTIIDAMGRATTLTYNPEGLVTQVDDPFGRSAAFEYDNNRNLIRITDMGGYWTSFSYDQDIYITEMGNERGTWGFYIEPTDDGDDNFSNPYPPPGGSMWENYRITVTNPKGGSEEYHFDGYIGDIAWYVSPKNYVKYVDRYNNNYQSSTPKTNYHLTSDSSGQGEISKIVKPDGGYVEYNYDSYGNRISASDSHGHTINYTYNSKGRVMSVTDAKENVTEFNYGDNGVDLIEIRNELGSILMTYNNYHDISSITDRLNSTTTFAYNNYGQLTSQTEPFGIVTTYAYDNEHNLQALTKNNQVIESFTYDAIGRIASHTDASNQTLTYDYNNLNNITAKTYPDDRSTTFTYSTCCPYLLDSLTDRSGKTTNYIYDAMKRLTGTVNSEGGRTRYVYDANGNPINLIDANSNTTVFDYDNANRLIGKTYADGKSILYEYNSEDLLIRRTNGRGIYADYSYDENHNIIAINYSDNTPDVVYNYDIHNRIHQRQVGVDVYQYSYDANDRLVTVNGPWNNDDLTFTYDDLGRRIGIIPQAGRAISYNYDNLSRLTGIQAGTDVYSYIYQEASPIVQRLIRPEGSYTNYQYDALNRLTEISNRSSADSIINQFAYTYNQQDLRSSETVTNGNPVEALQDELITYEYNNLNQLLSSANPVKLYEYDDDGNMTTGYTPDGFVFNAMYDAQNHLRSIEYTDGNGVLQKTEYDYDSDLVVKIRKYENNSIVSEKKSLRVGFLALQERDGNDNIIREYAWGLNMGGGIGGLLNLKQGGLDYSYLYDGKGNVSALIDGGGTIAASYTYDAFGKLMAKSGTLEQPFMFSTKFYDESLGLSNYGYRFYLGGLGRWLTRDPIGVSGGVNLYGFASNNPVNYIDLFGLCELSQNEWINFLRKLGKQLGLTKALAKALKAWKDLFDLSDIGFQQQKDLQNLKNTPISLYELVQYHEFNERYHEIKVQIGDRVATEFRDKSEKGVTESVKLAIEALLSALPGGSK